MATTTHEPVTIIVEFVQGVLDGSTLVAIDRGQIESLVNASDEEVEQAWNNFREIPKDERTVLCIYRDTHKGEIGKLFRIGVGDVKNVYPFRQTITHHGTDYVMETDLLRSVAYEYRITDKLEHGHEVLIRAIATDSGKSQVTFIGTSFPKKPK